jgi:hypothetical protein
MIMKCLVALIVIINLMACAVSLSPDVAQTEPDSAQNAAVENKSDTADSAKPIKSPHGYIITQDYEPGRFGGFIGDCSDDKNWPYYWQCMSENSGNGFK